jgi:peptidoglycan hydrolase CwlO-like protein
MRGAEIEELSKKVNILNNGYTSKKQKAEKDKKELLSIEAEIKEVEK